MAQEIGGEIINNLLPQRTPRPRRKVNQTQRDTDK